VFRVGVVSGNLRHDPLPLELVGAGKLPLPDHVFRDTPIIVGTVELYGAQRYLVEAVDEDDSPPVAVLRELLSGQTSDTAAPQVARGDSGRPRGRRREERGRRPRKRVRGRRCSASSSTAARTTSAPAPPLLSRATRVSRTSLHSDASAG
jgi:hypothetical protein